MEELKGLIQPKGKINGSLTDKTSISAETKVSAEELKGSLKTNLNVEGALRSKNLIKGEIELPNFSDYPTYQGEYVVTPKTYAASVLETQGKLLISDVIVTKIAYYETSNEFGKTVYIGSEV